MKGAFKRLVGTRRTDGSEPAKQQLMEEPRGPEKALPAFQGCCFCGFYCPSSVVNQQLLTTEL